MRPEMPKALPHSEESERAVLASILLKPSYVDLGAKLLPTPAVFYLERHQAIWRAYGKLRAEETPIDLRTLQAELERVGLIEKIGGMAYLAGLDMDLPDLGRFEHYCDILRERRARRQLLRAAAEMASDVQEGKPPEAIVAAVSERLHAIARDRESGDGLRDLTDYFADLDPWEREPEQTGITSGLADLDRLTLGWQPGQLIVVAGRPGMGKSAFALQVARHVAVDLRRPVAFFSLEMPERELAERLSAQQAALDLRLVKRPHRLGEDGKHRLLNAGRTLAAAPLRIDDKAGRTTAQVAAAAGLHQLRHGLDLVVIDLLSIMSYAGTARNRVERLAEMTADLKRTAKDLDAPVLLVHQLSRSHEHEGRMPRLRDLKDSGGVEENADQVIFLYRPEVYEPDNAEHRNVAYFLVDKHRGGPTGKVEAVWIGERVTFYDKAIQGQAPVRRDDGPPF